jgi:hypothetical protein
LVVDLNLPDAVFVRLTVPLGLSKTRLGIRPLAEAGPEEASVFVVVEPADEEDWWSLIVSVFVPISCQCLK